MKLRDSVDIVWERSNGEVKGRIVGGTEGGGGAGGVTDHGDLTGLTGDDHPQYLTQERHSSRARHDVSVLDPRITLTITQLPSGEWSGDLPARAEGENPAVLIGADDPEGPNGIDSPENVLNSDRWLNTSQ